MPGGRVAGQRCPEERHQRVGVRRVEHLRFDPRLVRHGRRIGLAVAVDRGATGGHLEEDHRGRVPFRGRVIAVAGTGEEGVEIGRRSRLRRRRGRPAQREVEQHQVLGPVTPVLPHPEVGRLDVAMIDTGLVQRDERVEQVRAEPVEQIDGQPGTSPENIGQGLRAGALQ